MSFSFGSSHSTYRSSRAPVASYRPRSSGAGPFLFLICQTASTPVEEAHIVTRQRRHRLARRTRNDSLRQFTALARPTAAAKGDSIEANRLSLCRRASHRHWPELDRNLRRLVSMPTLIVV